MDAPKPILIETSQNDEKNIKDIKFIYQFNSKLNNEIYSIMIGTLKDYLVIKVINNSNIEENYISFFTYEELKDISKSMRYFDDIKDIVSFLENKGKTKDIYLTKQKKNLLINFIVISPNGKGDLVSLELKSNELSDKELINHLLIKVDELEKKISFFKEEITKVDFCEQMIEYMNKEVSKVEELEKQINFLNKEASKVEELEKQINFLNKEVSKVNDLEKQINFLNKEVSKRNDIERQISYLNSKFFKINEIEIQISFLNKEIDKVNNLERQTNLLNNEVSNLKDLERQISLLNKEISKVNDLEKQININFFNKEASKINDLDKHININFSNNEIQFLNNEKNKEVELDSKITNINEIKFIIDYLKETNQLFKNKDLKLNLLYRGTTDGDRTENVHKKCDGLSNIIVFMKTEQGNSYGMYSVLGWNTRNEEYKYEYPIDNRAFLFSLNKKKIYKAIDGKSKVCWVKNKVGLLLYYSMGFYDNFLHVKKNINLFSGISSNFENCKMEDFNEGIKEFKFLEIEIFQIK